MYFSTPLFIFAKIYTKLLINTFLKGLEWKENIFDIPVYRLSESQYEVECKNIIKNNFNCSFKNSNKVFDLETYYEKSIKYFDIWEYNEIIGYIKLYILGSQIRGEYIQHKSSRIRKTRTKSFIFKTHKLAAEINIYNKTNEEIYLLISKYLENCKIELKNRYIDLDNFNQIGKYIAWNKLIADL